MEQYYLPKKFDFENLRYCLDNYELDSFLARLKFSSGGDVKIKENLEGRILDFSKNSFGLKFFIDSKEIINFPLKDYDKGFALEYERFKGKGDSKKIVLLDQGIDPNDENLPEPSRSSFRNIFDSHLVEIYFKGKIELEPYFCKEHDFVKWNIKKR